MYKIRDIFICEEEKEKIDMGITELKNNGNNSNIYR